MCHIAAFQSLNEMAAFVSGYVRFLILPEMQCPCHLSWPQTSEIWLVQQEPAEFCSIYGQAGFTEVSLSIDFSTTSLLAFFYFGMITAGSYSHQQLIVSQ